MSKAAAGAGGRGQKRGSRARRRLGAFVGSAGAVALLLATGFLGAEGRPAGAETAPREEALVELGRRLFFDPVVSRSGERACASCHSPDHGFSDPARVSEDDVGLTVRHSQTLIDGHLNPSAHWDGEFDGVEALVTARIGLTSGERGYGASSSALAAGHSSVPFPAEQVVGRDELGRVITPARGSAHGDKNARETLGGRVLTNGDLDRLPRAQDVLEEAGRYAPAFEAAFGSASISKARIARAIAAYCRSLRAAPSAFDRHLAGEEGALSPAARRGLDLFRGRAGCARCHTLDGKRPALSDYRYHNTGVAWRAYETRKRAALDAGERLFLDPGRQRISTVQSDLKRFKTPTLRDVARRGPYMHDGSLATLDDVVRFYARGAGGDPDQDPHLRPFLLSLGDDDLRSLVAFLEALTGEDRPGRARSRWPKEAARMRLRLVDAEGHPLPGVAVRLLAAGDDLPPPPGRPADCVRVESDEEGRFEAPPPPRTHWQVELPEGLLLRGGALVPDCCERADLVVPVSGRAALIVVFPAGATAPEVLVAEHEGTLVLPGHLPPRTRLTRIHVVEAEGEVVARYEGWRRTDVPASVRVRVPGVPEGLPATLGGREPARLVVR